MTPSTRRHLLTLSTGSAVRVSRILAPPPSYAPRKGTTRFLWQCRAVHSDAVPLSKRAARWEQQVEKAGNLITTIDLANLQPHPTNISIDEYELLTSYNWIDSHIKAPRIYVPGGAPVWTYPELPFKAEDSRGADYVHPKHPNWSVQTAFQALEVTCPLLNFNTVDLFANRAHLTALFGLCHGKTQPFMLRAYMVRDTLILEFPPDNLQVGGGYGFNFERHCAKYPSELPGSSSHWRVLRYSMGPLACVVRFEVDATLPLQGNESTGSAPETGLAPQSTGGGPATVTVRGSMAPHSRALEIKTRVLEERGAQNWAKNYAKVIAPLWFGCMGHVVFGLHANGNFRGIHMSDERDNVAAWAERPNVQAALRRMTALISAAKDAASICPRGMAYLISEPHKSELIRVYATKADDRGNVLESYYVNKFWGSRSTKLTKNK